VVEDPVVPENVSIVAVVIVLPSHPAVRAGLVLAV
jgi:hypothetical protein